MQKPGFAEVVEKLTEDDPRFHKDGYAFLREALEFTQKKRRKSRTGLGAHVTPVELLEGFRDHALKQFGPMTMTVLDYWGVRTSGDVGDMVFNLIEAGVFGKSAEDRREDFVGVLDFEAVFAAPFRHLPPMPKADAARRVAERTE